MNSSTIENHKKKIETIYDLNKDNLITKLEWMNIGREEILSEEFMRKHEHQLNWTNVGKYQKMSEEFLKEFENRLEWVDVCQNHLLSKSFIDKINVYVDFARFSKQDLTEETIEHYKKFIHWKVLSIHADLSENIIKKYKDKVHWLCISKFQTLSENFINEFKDVVEWKCIVRYQKISYEFVLRNLSKIDINSLSANNKIYLTNKQWEEIRRLFKFKNLFIKI